MLVQACGELYSPAPAIVIYCDMLVQARGELCSPAPDAAATRLICSDPGLNVTLSLALSSDLEPDPVLNQNVSNPNQHC